MLDKLWKYLNTFLESCDIVGTLDGQAFQEISFAASGKRAFIVKGWVDPREGPAVRVRADWEHLKEADIGFQEHPSDKGFQETTETGVVIDRGDWEMSLVATFKTDDGETHEIRFTAGLNIGDIFDNIL
jgi:hypothetical protein